jgi:hypothetical protein
VETWKKILMSLEAHGRLIQRVKTLVINRLTSLMLVRGTPTENHGRRGPAESSHTRQLFKGADRRLALNPLSSSTNGVKRILATAILEVIASVCAQQLRHLLKSVIELDCLSDGERRTFALCNVSTDKSTSHAEVSADIPVKQSVEVKTTTALLIALRAASAQKAMH